MDPTNNQQPPANGEGKETTPVIGAQPTPQDGSQQSGSAFGAGPVAGSAPANPSGTPAGGPFMSANSQQHKPNVLVVVLIVVGGLIVLGAVVAFLVGFMHGASNQTKNTAATTAAQESNKSAKNAVDLSTLNKVSFNAPADTSNYTPQTGAAGGQAFVLKGGTSDKYCDFNFGLYSAAQLPGTDLNGIVNPQLDNLRKLGATVDGPRADAAIILKDAQDSTATYSLPTLTFTTSVGNKHETDHYSVAILKDGERAVVERSCINLSGTPSATDLATVERAASNITITKE